MGKLNSQDLSEYDRYYHPKPAVVTKLPDIKSVRDYSEVFIKNPDGTYNSYKMVSGVWIKTGTNLGV